MRLALGQGERWTAAAWHVFLVAAGHACYGAGLLEGFVLQALKRAPSPLEPEGAAVRA